MTAMKHQHLTIRDFIHIPISKVYRYKAIIPLLPSHQLMGLGIHYYIFIFYRQQPSLSIDRQHPFAIAGILHRQITTGAPRTNSRMRATHSGKLSWFQLWSRHAEKDSAAKQRHMQSLQFVGCSTLCSKIGRGVKMQGQRTVTPLVREDVILCSIEVINARYHIPLLAKHLLICIFHLITIQNMRKRMLPTHQGRRFKCP